MEGTLSDKLVEMVKTEAGQKNFEDEFIK